ncbi:class I SAM-dependent methyltransferase [Streptomyces sp. NPDC052727]|uniref:class I SAM-dependent methyltransferase n=1 Tax=unclassified Streptomyces TaxID=2593676 RepID=UPI00343035AA
MTDQLIAGMDRHIVEEMNLADEPLVRSELDRYLEVRIPEGTRPEAVGADDLTGRTPRVWTEPFDRLPQNLYLARLGDLTVFGRKLISPLKRDGALAELNCSRICASSILGVHVSHQVHESGYSVFYTPLGAGEKLFLFERIAADPSTEIVHPFAYLAGGKERSSPPTGWSVAPERSENLGVGEEVLRRYTLGLLRRHAPEGAVFYDPACSTGQFLAELKQEFPSCTTVGQDLSADMVRLAATRVDRVVCDDAIRPGVADRSVDWMFLRFLNSEVVTTGYAFELFRALAGKVKDDGRIVVLGHTPVLLQSSFFQEQGFVVEQASGATEDGSYVFQYYVLRRG